MLRLSMLRVRYYKRCVSMFLALSVLCCGNGGHAAGSSAGVDVWTWVHRAFAPAAHHRMQQPLVAARVDAGAPGQFAVDGAAVGADERQAQSDPRHTRTPGKEQSWVRRAIAPSALAGALPRLQLEDDQGMAEPGHIPLGDGAGVSSGRLQGALHGGKADPQRMAFCAVPALRNGRYRAMCSAVSLLRAQAKPNNGQRPHPGQKKLFARKSTGKDVRPLQASAATRMPVGSPALDRLNVSTVLSCTPTLAKVKSLKAGTLESLSHGVAPAVTQGEPLTDRQAKFEKGDLAELLAGVQEMTQSIREMMRLPISSELIGRVFDLAQVWQSLLVAHDALTGSAGETAKGLQTASLETAKGLQTASLKAFMTAKGLADPLIGSSLEAVRMASQRGASDERVESVLDKLTQVSKVYSDSAVWLYSKAVELDPSKMSSSVAGMSKVTIDSIGLLNEQLGKLLNVEVSRVLSRFDRELLGINRPNTQPKESATCMVLNQDGESRVLRYGEAIPQLLYEDMDAVAFASQLTVSLNTDERGNLYLGPSGSSGVDLPLSSDVMWTRQMAAYAASASGETRDQHADEPLVPATVAAVTIPVNANGDVLLTQRAFRGMYDGMWVFPGGHVDKGEALLTAAVREVREETGLAVDPKSLQPLAVWEGAVSSKNKQFCVVFFAADAMCESARECSMELQTKEVHRAAWVPKDLLPRILDAHVLHDLEIDGVLMENNEQHDTKIKMAELQKGLGEGHKFALRAYLDSLKGGHSGGRSAAGTEQTESPQGAWAGSQIPVRPDACDGARGVDQVASRNSHWAAGLPVRAAVGVAALGGLGTLSF